MRPIERTEDQKLNTLIDLVEQFRNKRVLDNPHNPLATGPRNYFIGLTNLAFPTTYVWASRGAITDDTLVNPRIRDDFVFAEVRVGTAKGTGLGYSNEFSPIENGLKSLEPIINGTILDARRSSYRDYYHHLGDSGLDQSAFIHHLAAVESVRAIQSPVERRIPTQRIKQLAKQASEILSEGGKDGRVRISIHDEVRRYVNSQGTVILDSFFGYHLRFMVTLLDSEHRKMEFVQNLYFTDGSRMDRDQILAYVRNMNREVELRRDCPTVHPGTYDLLFDPGAMATQLHEAIVHLAASDMILTEKACTWGWENFGRRIANRHLSVYANPEDPEDPNQWGSMSHDYEGVPARRRALVENGVVRGYLADRDGAFALSEKTGGEIFPGDSRFQIVNNGTAFDPQPRISNLDIVWSGRGYRRQELKQQFRRLLERSGKPGIYIPDGSGAGSYMESGEIEANPNFPYIVTSDGKFVPAKFVVTRDNASRFVNSISAMDNQMVYCGHRCGDSESMATVRAGITCGAGIVKGITVTAYRPEQRRI